MLAFGVYIFYKSLNALPFIINGKRNYDPLFRKRNINMCSLYFHVSFIFQKINQYLLFDFLYIEHLFFFFMDKILHSHFE
jgi:hypothetical protein